MRIQYFIFNYGHFDNAMKLFNEFTDAGCDTYLLNCESTYDPPFEATEKIKKFPNIYYSGQWNEALKLLNADVLFITNADVAVKSVPTLVQKMEKFYNKHGSKAGLYAPNVSWTPWTYNPASLPDLGNGVKRVVATDSVIWSLDSVVAHKFGQIDLALNKLGWGIEIITAWYCCLEGKYVARDYSIRCDHPQSTSYNRYDADLQWRRMASKMKLGKDFWDYYDSRSKFHFGWDGDDDPAKFTCYKTML